MIVKDIPAADEVRIGTFDDWRAHDLSPQVLRDCSFVALADGDVVGYATLHAGDNGEGLNAMTGVVPRVETSRCGARAQAGADRRREAAWAAAAANEQRDGEPDARGERAARVSGATSTGCTCEDRCWTVGTDDRDHEGRDGRRPRDVHRDLERDHARGPCVHRSRANPQRPGATEDLSPGGDRWSTRRLRVCRPFPDGGSRLRLAACAPVGSPAAASARLCCVLWRNI